MGVGDDVFGVLPGDEVADGDDPGPVEVVVQVGLSPELVLAGVLLVPGVCVEVPLVQELPIQTGALPFTGALGEAAGSTPTVPIWPVTIELDTVCGPPPPLLLVLLFGPVELCVELPPLQLLATHTGALPFTGALSEAAGSTPAEPTWTDPIDSSTFCGPKPPLE